MVVAFILMDVFLMLIRRGRDKNMKLKINNLKEYRTQANLTQPQLADQIFVSVNTISNIERGKYTPSLALASKLAKFFNCNIEDLFKFDIEEFIDD